MLPSVGGKYLRSKLGNVGAQNEAERSGKPTMDTQQARLDKVNGRMGGWQCVVAQALFWGRLASWKSRSRALSEPGLRSENNSLSRLCVRAVSAGTDPSKWKSR